jgi:hypothetical protein
VECGAKRVGEWKGQAFMMKRTWPAVWSLVAGCLLAAQMHAGEPALQPLMLLPDQVLFEDDFSTPRGELKPKKAEDGDSWIPNQGTRWVVEEGVLRGRPSLPEFQASHKTHQGLHPRIVLAKTPQNYILRFSMRLVDGKPFVAGQRRSISPFIEMGHHIARVTWGANGAMLLADGDSLQIASAADFKLETGRWYQVMVEKREDEVVVQFAGGPALHGKHPSYVSDKHFVMIGGLEGGVMELKGVTVWSPKEGSRPEWPQTLAKMPPPQDVRIKPAKPAVEEKK